MLNASLNFKKATFNFRRQIVKVAAKCLTPKLYSDFYEFNVNNPRPMIKFIHDNFSGPLTGVEIGVFTGENAYSILQTLNIDKLTLIDPFLPYQEGNIHRDVPTDAYFTTVNRLKKYESKTCIIQSNSTVAAQTIPDNSLDFCYIDGNHTYENVKNDIELFYSKIKSGGVIGGHDFNTMFQGVVFATVEFAKTRNLTLNIAVIDWWIIKK